MSGYWIFNNIIQNNTLGVFLEPNSGTTTSQVRQNLIRDNVSPTGNGLFTRAINVLIDSNLFTGHRENASINITDDSTNVIVTNNDILNDTSITLAGSTNVKIANNRLIDTQGTAIFIGGNTNITEIEGNTLSGSTGNGISVNNIFSPIPNQNIRAKDNSIEGNQSAGLNVAAASYNDTPPNRPLDATNNWWGSPSGPNYNGTGPGTGQTITDPSNVVLYTPFLTANPAPPTPTAPVTPIQRLVSNPSSVYITTDRNSAVLVAISGIGQVATEQPQLYMWWPNLQKFANDNSPFGGTPNPVYIWDNTTSDGQTRGFAISSNPFILDAASQLVINLNAFADNALEAQIDLVDAATNQIISAPPMGALLTDGSMNPNTGVTVETSPPYNWQSIRFYSVVTAPILPGSYKVIVSFQVVNYSNFSGYPNPAGLAFVADIYQAI
ncbi:right-handed parallel beta-helix repeat-containing protein [Cohnella cellulosilytica]|uniref:Right-handed parallel beta-helix repeat-containing protein n=1 Tax=Cohnella cellulosilytica TaxID=986710 RepID=A0ABW2FBS2_9BACL